MSLRNRRPHKTKGCDSLSESPTAQSKAKQQTQRQLNKFTEVKQDSQRWRKRAILLIYLVQICLKPKQKQSNSSMNLKELSKPWRNISAVVPLPSVDL
ncbi:unnamed protein product [Rhodiola kirilowii]